MDIYDQWLRYDDEKEQRLAERPVCVECDEHIQDDFCYEINDELICPTCMEELHRKAVEDYV